MHRSAELCLRNFAPLASPDGYLFVSGVDLDVRTKVALDLGWEPVPELLDRDPRRRPLGSRRLAMALVGSGAA